MDQIEAINEHESDEPIVTNADSPACDSEGRHAEETAPKRSRDGLLELKADEVDRRLREGIPIHNARVIGRLRLRGRFEKPILLQNVEAANLVIDGAIFDTEVAFKGCRLNRMTINRKVQFIGGVSFEGSELTKPKFDDVKIHGKANFQAVRVRGKADFLRIRFFGGANFWEANFEGWVDFKQCRFDEPADFRSICAEEGFVMRQCHFVSAFLFRGASVSKKFDFGDSRFEGRLDLAKAKIHDFAYLESIEQGEGFRFSCWNAVAERIQIRPEQVQGRLASECEGDHGAAMSEYGLLKRNFEALHRHEEEDWAFYRFKVNERRSKRRSWRRPWSKFSQAFEWLVLDLGCRYGTSPFRTVAAAAAMILAFSLVYMIDVRSLPMEVDSNRIPFPGQPFESIPNRVVIGLVTSVSAFTDGLGSLRETATGWMNLFLVVESLLGTLVWGLFVVAFSRKVIR